MKKMGILALLGWTAVLTGCVVHTSREQMPWASQAARLPGPEKPLLLFEEEIPAAMPHGIAYAVVNSWGDKGRAGLARHAAAEAKSLRPDWIVVTSMGQVELNNTIAVQWLPGLATGFGGNANSLRAVCVRRAPCIFGFRWTEEAVVVSCIPEAFPEGPGLKTGDVLIAIGGFGPKEQRMVEVLLTSKAGQAIPVVWKRGDQIMEGSTVTLPNDGQLPTKGSVTP